jgi:sortase (surface protein transpeptidase)
MSLANMNKLNIFLVAVIISLIAIGHQDIANALSVISTDTVNISIVPTAPTPTPTPVIGIPKQIIIEKIQVNIPIESLGVNTDGSMQTPTNFLEAGWYSLGARPGEFGKAAIDGHLDQTTGAPAAFWNLHLLEIGDIIKIIDDRNTTYVFRITDKEKYDYETFPLDKLVGKSNKRELNLVTCTGWWNFQTHNYSHRMLISSELIETIPFLKQP